MLSRNSEDRFETLPHTPDQGLFLLLTDTLVIAGPTLPGLGKNSLRRVVSVIVQPILPNKMPRQVKVLLRPNS